MRGDRVRGGPAVAARNTSSKAMQRYQVKQTPRSIESVPESKYNDDEDEEEGDEDDEYENVDENAATTRAYVAPRQSGGVNDAELPPSYSARKEELDEEYSADFNSDDGNDDDDSGDGKDDFTINVNTMNFDETANPFDHNAEVTWSVKEMEEGGSRAINRNMSEDIDMALFETGKERKEGSDSKEEDVVDARERHEGLNPLQPADSLEELVAEARARCVEAVGENLFQRLYVLCRSHMTRPIDAQSEQTIQKNRDIVKEMGDILQEQLLNGGADVACDAVMKVKVLLALETRQRDSLSLNRK